MKNDQKTFSITNAEQKRLKYELKLLKNLSSGLCSSLERMLDYSESLPEEQMSRVLQELENSKQNILAVALYLTKKKRTELKKKPKLNPLDYQEKI